MPTQSTRAKAQYHLERAEYWHEKVEALEDWAERKAALQEQGRMSRKDGSKLEIGYLAGVILTDYFPYTNAVANRNAHQRRAEIYALAAMAGIVATSGVLGDDGKIRMPREKDS